MRSIDIEKLLLPVSDESPCGEDLEYDPSFMEIEQELEGKAEQQMGDSVIEAEEPDWKKIFSDSVELLNRTHDLRVLIFLIRAGIKKDGFSSLSDGLTVLSGWIETQWDFIFPQLDPDDDNDPTERVNVLMTLCDLDVIIKPISAIPVVESNALGKFNFKQIKAAHEGADEPNLATIEAAFIDSELEQLQQTSQCVILSVEMLDAIESNVTQYVGVGYGPNLSGVIKVLKEISSILSEYIVIKGGDSLGEGMQEGGENTEGNVGVSSNSTVKVQGVGNISSSQDVTKALEKIIEYYAKNEPSSPVPLLLERAKGLVNMDFMSIIKNIASEGETQVKNIRGPVEGDEDDY